MPFVVCEWKGVDTDRTINPSTEPGRKVGMQVKCDSIQQPTNFQLDPPEDPTVNSRDFSVFPTRSFQFGGTSSDQTVMYDESIFPSSCYPHSPHVTSPRIKGLGESRTGVPDPIIPSSWFLFLFLSPPPFYLCLKGPSLSTIILHHTSTKDNLSSVVPTDSPGTTWPRIAPLRAHLTQLVGSKSALNLTYRFPRQECPATCPSKRHILLSTK